MSQLAKDRQTNPEIPIEKLVEEAHKYNLRLVPMNGDRMLVACTCGGTRRFNMTFFSKKLGRPCYALICQTCGKTVRAATYSAAKRKWNERIFSERYYGVNPFANEDLEEVPPPPDTTNAYKREARKRRKAKHEDNT